MIYSYCSHFESCEVSYFSISANIRYIIPAINAITLAVVSSFPIDLNIILNSSELHELTFEPKIAALIYLIENKNADIKQNTTPANLLLILHTPI